MFLIARSALSSCTRRRAFFLPFTMSIWRSNCKRRRRRGGLKHENRALTHLFARLLGVDHVGLFDFVSASVGHWRRRRSLVRSPARLFKRSFAPSMSRFRVCIVVISLFMRT